MLAADKGNMDEFWRAYPDGYLISIIRSPLSWHPSFVKLKGRKDASIRQCRSDRGPME